MADPVVALIHIALGIERYATGTVNCPLSDPLIAKGVSNCPVGDIFKTRVAVPSKNPLLEGVTSLAGSCIGSRR